MTDKVDFTLAELMIVAASEAWRSDGEVVASGIGIIPRLGASLAKLTHSPELLMTDSEARLVEEPIPLGPRGDYVPRYSGCLNFERMFECVAGGQRHAMIGPTQIDRFGQSNLSCIGDYQKPKVAMLGVRGLPGNSINHINSFLVPFHSRKALVADEVDMVSGVGYNPARFSEHMRRDLMSIRHIVSDLCVLDFEGENHAVRVRSLHPGVTFEEVQANTGFELQKAPNMAETPAPSVEQLDIIRRLDPHNLRAKALKDNPPGTRTEPVGQR